MKSFIIQARLGSSRLPNKIVLPFYNNATILDILIDKLKAFPQYDIILATSSNKENDLLESIALDKHIKCFRGCETDVLNRFISAAKYYDIDEIIRVCSDNPMLDMHSIQKLVDIDSANYDYISYSVNGMPSIKTHFGFWTEYVKLNALEKVAHSTNDDIYHEHVTNYIYGHPNDFKIKWLEVPNCLYGRNDIRMTIDTLEDFKIMSNIYTNLVEERGDVEISEIVNYLDNNTDYLDSMKKQIDKNTK